MLKSTRNKSGLALGIFLLIISTTYLLQGRYVSIADYGFRSKELVEQQHIEPETDWVPLHEQDTQIIEEQGQNAPPDSPSEPVVTDEGLVTGSPEPVEAVQPAPPAEEPKEPSEPRPRYKPEKVLKLPLIVDNFPLAAAAHSASDLPPIPPWNEPPKPHVPEKTPLFIGFTRNWRLLQQTVVSYITAGWPPEDIYVIENTGTMRSNELGLLSMQNPFFLNHTRLHMFGVNIVTTPTLFTFAQLQNFFIWLAIENDFPTYFYGHMDVLVLPYEDQYTAIGNNEHTYEGYKSIYIRAVEALRLATSSEPDPNAFDSNKPWAARFFSYDRLALVNRAAYESIGAWDTLIPYYMTDCDMHDRLKMHGFEYNEDDVKIGDFHDIAGSLDDLLVLYRKKDTGAASFTFDKSVPEHNDANKRESTSSPHRRLQNNEWISDDIGSDAFKQLSAVAAEIENDKSSKGPDGRNSWQARQEGGAGEPYYRDSEGFEAGMQIIMQSGRQVYAEKWGHMGCGLLQLGMKAGDEWRVEHDWEDGE